MAGQSTAENIVQIDDSGRDALGLTGQFDVVIHTLSMFLPFW